MSKRILALATIACMQLCAVTTITVTTNLDTAQAAGGNFTSPSMTDLRGALNYINTLSSLSGPYVIVFNGITPSISLNAPLPPINFSVVGTNLANNTVTIDGSNGSSSATSQITIAGNGFRPFYAYTGNVILQNMTISGKAQGGGGGTGSGGGGAGLGGGLFVDGATVIANNVKFTSCNATGGQGGSTTGTSAGGFSGGGGGGMGGNGGPGTTSSTSGKSGGAGGGGGAFTGNGGSGGATSTNNGGSGGGGGSFMTAAAGGTGGATASGGGGGGGGYGSVVTNTGTGGSNGGAGSGGLGGGSLNSVNLGGGGGGGGTQTATSGAGGTTLGTACTGNVAPNNIGGGGGNTGTNPPCANGSTGGVGGLGGGGGGQGDNITGPFGAGVGGLGGGGGGSSQSGGVGTGGIGGYFGGGGGSGGAGGFGGGGGGAAVFQTNLAAAGTGGFGGGGGGAGGGVTGGTAALVINSGSGGFGGGAGGLNNNSSLGGSNLGTPGTAGGVAASAGGGGAALGAAVFVRGGSGSFTMQTNSSTANFASASATSLSSQTAATAAATGTSFSGFAGPGNSTAGSTLTGTTVQEIFSVSSTLPINFYATNAGDTVTIGASIADDTINSIPASSTYTAGNGTGVPININGTNAILTTAGLGKVVFPNATNTNVGTTTIFGGTLNIAGDGSLGTGSGASNAVAFSGTSTLQPAAAISSSTRPIQVNAGATGMIDTQFGNLTNSGTVTTASGSTLTKINAGTLTLNGNNLSSPGAYAVSAGTMVLGGVNSYTGTTTVSSGATLQAAAVNALSTGSQHILNGGTVNLNSYNQTIGSLNGSSGTVALGSGILTLGGDNTTSTFGGTITSSGAGNGVIFVGSGTFTLSGTNSYTGSTTVNNGVVKVTGSLAGSAVVNNGGTLKGNGKINGSVLVFSGGAITPGSSIGTMSTGPLTLTTGSITNLEVNPTTSSVIAVTGNASIAGTLNVIADSGSYAVSNSYGFLTTTGTVTGTYSNVTISGLPGAVATLTYYPNSIALNISLASSITSGFSCNQGLATALSASLSPSLLTSIFSSGSVCKTLASISPARNAMTAFTNMNAVFSVTNMMGTRLSTQRSLHVYGGTKAQAIASRNVFDPNELLAAKKTNLPQGSIKKAAAGPDTNCLWLEGIGDWASQDGQNQIPHLNFQTYGVSLGYDSFGWTNGMAGVMATYLRTNLDFANGQGSGDVNSFTVGPYGTVYFDNAFLELGLFGTGNQNTNLRRVTLPGLTGVAYSTYNSYQLTPHLSIGYDWTLDDPNWVILEPFGEVDLIVDWERGYTESGGPVLMQVQGKTLTFLRSELGMRSYQVGKETWGTWVLREVAGYVNKTSWGTKSFVGALVGSPNSFTFEGFTESQNLLTLGLEAFVRGNDGWFGAVSYDGEFFSGYVSNEAQATVGVYF